MFISAASEFRRYTFVKFSDADSHEVIIRYNLEFISMTCELIMRPVSRIVRPVSRIGRPVSLRLESREIHCCIYGVLWGFFGLLFQNFVADENKYSGLALPENKFSGRAHAEKK